MSVQREISRIPVGMRPGLRQLNEASLRVCMSEAVPEHMRAKVREITNVFVEPTARKQRLATALLNCVCQEADANGMTLVLTARPSNDEGPNEETLLAWYEKFGFTKIQDTPHGWFMARQVHEKPLIVSVADAVRESIRDAMSAQEAH